MQAKENLVEKGKRSKREMHVRNKKKSANKGITLVALVITIVVLLILAGITIVYLFGNNGVFQKAQDAQKETENSKFEERLSMATSDAFMERAKKGGLTPEEFFEILKNHGIISETTVGGGNISNPTENSDGSKIYQITSEDDYIFEVKIYPDGRVETEVIGKDGNIEAKIRSIIVTSKTKTEIRIRVSARLQGGSVKAYYKKAVDVVANEAEDSIEGYTEIVLNENLEGIVSGLTAGEAYKIKAILKNGETVVNAKSIQETASPLVLINSITLNRKSLTIGVGGKETLTATIKPDNADDKTLTWTTKDATIATVSNNGEVTGVKGGETTITVTANDASKETVSCKVIVETNEPREISYSWEELEEIAKKISNEEAENQNGDKITADVTRVKESTKAIVTIGEEEKTIRVGDWKKIDGRRVRILGFNQDTLTTADAYEEGTKTGKAGISFEYWDCLMENPSMDNTNNHLNGWVTKKLYKTLNTNADAKYIDLKDNKKIPIKQVEKTYNAPVNVGDNIPKTSSDYLWLLSCTEIWGDSAETVSGCVSGNSKAKEGEQYAFYANCGQKPVYEVSNGYVIHYNSVGNAAVSCWLRSTHAYYLASFCDASADGRNTHREANLSRGVCPGFCI